MNLFFATVGAWPTERPWREVLSQLPHLPHYHPWECWSEGGVVLGSSGFRAIPPVVPHRLGALTAVGEVRWDQPERLGGADADSLNLVTEGWQQWQEQVTERMNGDFAWALWDGARQELHGARDVYGVRPFYYEVRGGSLAVANFPTFFRAWRGQADEFDESALADFLLFEMPLDNAATGWKNVRRLKPGHVLRWRNHQLTTSCYRQFTPPKILRLKRREDYIEAYREVLGQAVRARMIGQERVSVFMSGGLDSTSVAAMAHRQRPEVSLHAFTLSCSKLIPDEEAYYAQIAAEHLGIGWTEIPVDDIELFAGSERWQRNSAFPLTGLTVGHADRALPLVQEHGSRVLTGALGDNLFRSEPWPFLWREIRSRYGWGTLGAMLSDSIRHRRFPPLAIRSEFKKWWQAPRTTQRFPHWLRREFVQKYGLKERWEAYQREDQYAHWPRPLAARSCFASFWPYNFACEHHAVTGAAVESCHPLTDERVVNFLMSVPSVPWFFFKELGREAMRGYMPDKIRLRPKTPLRGDPILIQLQSSQRKLSAQARDHSVVSEMVDLNRLSLWSSPQFRGSKDAFELRPLYLQSWLD